MTRKMLYLIGEPGVGKTTLVRRIVKNVPGEVRTVPNVSWTHYSNKVCQIGHDRGVFGGTDALGMAAQKHVLAWLEQYTVPGRKTDGGYQYVLAEGDRLANGKFFDAVRELGWELDVVVLMLDEEELNRRREERNRRIGKAQDERWLKTRATKVRNLTPQATLILDASEPTRTLFEDLLEHFEVVKQIRRLRTRAK